MKRHFIYQIKNQNHQMSFKQLLNLLPMLKNIQKEKTIFNFHILFIKY